MDQKVYNVLFICTGNSARSIMAEAMLNTIGNGRFRAFSAGSYPRGSVNPLAIEQIKSAGYPTDALRSKSWSEFAEEDAPRMDFVITVCDKAAGEVCPVWPGQPTTAHWGFADPAAAEGSDEEKRQAFKKIWYEIKTRLDIFMSLPLETLERLAIKYELGKIGRTHIQEDAAAASKVYNVLFICTGNSARSVMSEALVDILGRGRFKGYSAGSKPGGRVNPFAIEQIKAFDLSYPTQDMRSKSWNEFSGADAPKMDFIITVCDNAAGEECPYWPGHPATAHWGYEDPAALEGTDEEKQAIFNKVFRQIMQRISRFVNLPINAMETDAIRAELKAIGEMEV